VEKKFSLPGVSCDRCQGRLSLHLSVSGFRVKKFFTKCDECGAEDDLAEKAGSAVEGSKQKLKAWGVQISSKLMELKKTLPKDKDEWGAVVKDPKHPFTAALLSALVLILLEASGFGIFVAVTWILGNLVLNPLGWMLIPLVVAIVVQNRNKFRSERIKEIKEKLNDLENEKEYGEITEEEFDLRKKRLFEDFLS